MATKQPVFPQYYTITSKELFNQIVVILDREFQELKCGVSFSSILMTIHPG